MRVGKDDYSLNVAALAAATLEEQCEEAAAPAKAGTGKKRAPQSDLFAEAPGK
jgi:hypothetical protein